MQRELRRSFEIQIRLHHTQNGFRRPQLMSPPKSPKVCSDDRRDFAVIYFLYILYAIYRRCSTAHQSVFSTHIAHVSARYYTYNITRRTGCPLVMVFIGQNESLLSTVLCTNSVSCRKISARVASNFHHCMWIMHYA